MKVEDTNKDTVLNLANYKGVKPQVEAGLVKHVILQNGNILPCGPGSVHYFITTTNKERMMPYIQFDTTAFSTGHPSQIETTRVELFPNAVAGIAYDKPSDDVE